jgi:hypothetical protein
VQLEASHEAFHGSVIANREAQALANQQPHVFCQKKMSMFFRITYTHTHTFTDVKQIFVSV